MKAILTLLAIGSSLGLGYGVYHYSSVAANTSVPPVVKQPIAVEVMVSAERPMEDRAELVGSLMAGAEVQILAHRNGSASRKKSSPGPRRRLWSRKPKRKRPWRRKLWL